MPQRQPEVVMYSRQTCHLCDVALEVLRRHGLTPTVLDVDQDPQLVARYTNCVPVVVIDGKERFRGRINERLLRRELSAWRRGHQGLP